MSVQHVNRITVLTALWTAAQAMDATPERLTAASGYRHFRATHAEAAEHPSPVAIAMLFGGWQRARQQAGVTALRAGGTDEHVRHVLYGEPRGTGRLTPGSRRRSGRGFTPVP